jgi:hypothetical protein
MQKMDFAIARYRFAVYSTSEPRAIARGQILDVPGYRQTTGIWSAPAPKMT